MPAATAAPPTQRERMVRGMAEVVAEQGYAATTVAHVIARAGISRRTFYEHFTDRLDCFLAAYDDAADLLAQGMADAFAQRAPRDRLRAVMTTYLDLLADEPAFAHTFLVAVYGAGPQALRRRVAVFERFAELIGEMNRELAAQDPSVRRLAPFEVRALVGAISSVVTMEIAAGRTTALPGLADDVVALIDRTFAA